MADLKMDTQAVINTANEIKNINKKINNDFNDTYKKIRALDNSWDGSASSAAFGKFEELRNNYYDARYTVVDNYVSFLYNQVGVGYENTESTNVKIADQLAAQFK